MWSIKSLSTDERGGIVHLALSVIQMSSAALACLLCVSLPRRPSVFLKGQAVDGQFTVSLLSRWSFSWANRLLASAKANHGLDMAHLPQLHLRARSKFLETSFSARRCSDTLWKALLRSHCLELFVQSLLAISQGIVQFAPQLAMYKLLKLIEQRSAGYAIANQAWWWTAALGLSIFVTAWIEAFMHWVSWARVGTLIRSELSALIFTKSMRRKDVKGTQQAAAENTVETSPIGPTLQAIDHDDEERQKSRRAVVNLIALDTKQVTDFAKDHWIFSQTLAKLLTSIAFLANLIGWQSLVAGFTVTAIASPLNVWASRSYAKIQGDLMRARDDKMEVVTEGLQGIRQIKFTALELQWQAKIGMKRGVELSLQRKSFAVNTVLIGIWILGPVMLSAVALAVYAILHGGLSPSIAFTTITVFGQIEATLAIVPGIISNLLGR